MTKRKPLKLGPEELKRARYTIRQLSTLLEPVDLYTGIIEESNRGKRPHPSGDPWGYTRDQIRTLAPERDPEVVIRLLKEAGAHDDRQAARWLRRHAELVP